VFVTSGGELSSNFVDGPIIWGKLTSNTILITGGASGIGYELTKQLTALGNTILITGRDQAKMDRARAGFPKVHTFRSDGSDPEEIATLYEKVTKQFPDLNMLINNAGIMRAINVHDKGGSLEDITREIEINLNGPQGKVAVITGATQGIGLATARLFVSEGAYVFITGRRHKELEEAVTSIGSNVTGVQGDASNLADLDRLYESVKARGRIDILFTNAGWGGFVPLGSITEEHYDQIFDTSVRGLLFTVQKALPLLTDGASIILTGAAAGSKGTPSFGVASATKAAIRSFARTWTVELKDRRIRTNVLSPGPVLTAALTAAMPAEAFGRIVSTVPMGRMAEPEEISKVALFLGSDDSSFVTGIELFADGGRAQV
jgi:NAD(P)-dependent dehydrogenase (short-subunit alcohol dehydrogenase family)